MLVTLDDADRCRAALVKLLPVWLREATSACFLVTARGRIGVSGEHRLDVGPLELPRAREKDADAIASASAVQLFARRAAAGTSGLPDLRLQCTDRRDDRAEARGGPARDRAGASRMLALWSATSPVCSSSGSTSSRTSGASGRFAPRSRCPGRSSTRRTRTSSPRARVLAGKVHVSKLIRRILSAALALGFGSPPGLEAKQGDLPVLTKAAQIRALALAGNRR